MAKTQIMDIMKEQMDKMHSSLSAGFEYGHDYNILKAIVEYCHDEHLVENLVRSLKDKLLVNKVRSWMGAS